MATRIFMLIGWGFLLAPTDADESSRFLREYPAASVALESATKNVIYSGRLQTVDYEGPVRFIKLGGDRDWLLKQFDATSSSLPWKRRVESFSEDWFFMLDGASQSAPYEFKGVDFPRSMPEAKAKQLEFRRWLRCNRFCCALYNVFGSRVIDLVAKEGFRIISEGPTGRDGEYEVRFTVKSITDLTSHVFLDGRMLFNERLSWALIEYDLMYEYPSTGAVDYLMSRAEPRTLADGSILPANVVVRMGVPVAGKATKLGKPEWPGNEIHETARFDEVVIGQARSEDFMPSAFGLPDHLVLGTASGDGPAVSWWLLCLIAVNGIAIVWWFIRRRNSKPL
jgi:hypothetical protein